MKVCKFILVLLILSLLRAYAYSATPPLGLLRLSLTEGDIQVKTEDTSDWVPAAINTPLKEGDQIWVPAGGRAEIQSTAGSCVRLGEHSSLEILNTENNSFRF